eukprot:scaffold19596_cov16-Tisochrysis_lutea.AAC.2
MHSMQAHTIDSSQLQATVHQLQLSKNAREDEISEIKALLDQLKQKARKTPSKVKKTAPSSSSASTASAGPLVLGTKCLLSHCLFLRRFNPITIAVYPEVPVDVVLDRRLGTLEEANALFNQFQKD